jgi:hypothetical protein
VVEGTGWKSGASSFATLAASGIQKLDRGLAEVEGVEDVLVVQKRLDSDLAQAQVQVQERRGTVAQTAQRGLKMCYRTCREGQGESFAARKCEPVVMTSRQVSMLQLFGQIVTYRISAKDIN